MQVAWVQSLDQEDLLEEEMAIHSSILAWKIPLTDTGYSPWGRKESDMTEQLHFHYTLCNLQFSSVQSLSRVRLFPTP